jgi:hypothetical protein
VRQKLVLTDITLPPTKEGQEVFDYIQEFYEHMPEGYIAEGSGIRYTIAVALPEEYVTYIMFRWPHLIDLEIDPELHNSDAIRYQVEINDRVLNISTATTKLDK